MTAKATKLQWYEDHLDRIEQHTENAICTVANPTARALTIRDLENKVISYDANSNLRQQTQGFRLTQTLKTAHERLKAAGR
jgi:hypothetical protein